MMSGEQGGKGGELGGCCCAVRCVCVHVHACLFIASAMSPLLLCNPPRLSCAAQCAVCVCVYACVHMHALSCSSPSSLAPPHPVPCVG